MSEAKESMPAGASPMHNDEQFAQRLANIHDKIASGKWRSDPQSQERSGEASVLRSSSSGDAAESKDHANSNCPSDRDVAPESLADLLILIEEVRQIEPHLMAETDCEKIDRLDNPLLGQAAETLPDATDTARALGDDTPCQNTNLEDLNSMARGKHIEGELAFSSPASKFQLGRFEIQELIGKGGFGLVYAAHDPQLDRRVAIKIPKPEALLSRTLRKRFMREGRAAACLSHPNIVAVHEVGQQGPICYMATELIKGSNLAEWSQSQDFDPWLIARIMANLADAIQHAHSRGILHRDLKPANILMEGENPMVTDFGLAQRLESDSLAGELSVETGILGTPAFMSPEQAVGNRDQIDYRADVYGLGAILYFLLTKRSPFTGSSPVEVLEAVRNSHPTPPARLNPRVPLDLQSICLKCLEKSAGDRYGSAYALHTDLQHYLAGRTVSARRITKMEQVIRWSRRNPLLAGLGASTAAAFSFAVVVSSIAWYSTRQSLIREQAARVESDMAYQDAKKAIDKYFVTVSQNQLLSAPGLKTLRQELLQNAVTYYMGFIEKNQDDQSLVSDLIRAYTYRAIIDDELGNYTIAREGFETALQLLDSLQGDADSNLEFQQQRGMILRKLSRLDRQAGDSTAALSRIAQAIAIHRDLLHADFNPAANHGELGMLLNNQANIETQTGNPKLAAELHRESEVHFQAAAKLEPENPTWRHQVSIAKASLAANRLAIGDSQASELLLTDVAETLRKLIDEYPDQLGFQMDLGKALANLSLAQGNLGRPDDQLKSLQEATRVFDRLATVHPQVVLYQALRASTRRSAGLVLSNLSRMTECATLADEAIDILQGVVHKAPGNAGIHQELTLAQCLLGRVWLNLGDTVKARGFLTSAIESLEPAFEQNSGDLYAGQNLAEAYQQLALASEESSDAAEYLDRAQRVVEKLIEKWPNNGVLVEMLAAIENSRQQLSVQK